MSCLGYDIKGISVVIQVMPTHSIRNSNEVTLMSMALKSF